MGYNHNWEELQDRLINKRIVSWDAECLVLDDGTKVFIQESDQDCCAHAGGEFTDVTLDAMITDVSKPVVTNEDIEEDWGEREVETRVTIFHNQNPIAYANASANNGNGGYYFSIASLVIDDVHFPVAEA